MAFPSHVVLQFSYNKLFLCPGDDVKDRPQGFISRSGESFYDVRSHLGLEKSERDGGLVHIKCLYNNKYWQRLLENNDISASAIQPEEDKTKMSCTLFKPIYVDRRQNTLHLLHVQSGFYADFESQGTVVGTITVNDSLATRNLSSPRFVFRIIDVEQTFLMPSYVAFKGDNHKYLHVVNIDGEQHFQFSSKTLAHEYAAHEVYKNPDGTISVQSVHNAKFWWPLSNWILADADTATSTYTNFSTFKVDDDVVALRSINDRFVKRFTDKGKVDCLSAKTSYIDASARLQVEELVISRRIYNVKFRFDDARIYNKSSNDVVIAAAGAINNTDKPTNLDVKLSYSESKTSSWMSLASTKLKHVPTTLESCIPRVEDGMIQMSSGKFQEAYQWGVTQEWKTAMENACTLRVPPKTKMAVKLIATPCSYDVPFSYTQRDALMNGNTEIQDMDDGKYTGTNYFGIKFVTTEEKLQHHI